MAAKAGSAPKRRANVKRSISVPAKMAREVREIAKARRLSQNRVFIDLISTGIGMHRRAKEELGDLLERFRSATDAKESKRLGNELGAAIFNGRGRPAALRSAARLPRRA